MLEQLADVVISATAKELEHIEDVSARAIDVDSVFIVVAFYSQATAHLSAEMDVWTNRSMKESFLGVGVSFVNKAMEVALFFPCPVAIC
jgi:hypothetical protein